MRAFGPVPSRRLGRSLGVNNIPPKVCTYACVYCQVGRTTSMRVARQRFYEPDQIVADVRAKVRQAAAADVEVDYICFVPDGEPTLDIHLGVEIEQLKPLGIPIGVITNGSLLGRADADWNVVEALVAQGRLVQTVYGGQTFYLRALHKVNNV